MDVQEYFNEIQEFVKQNIDDSSQIEAIIKSLEDDNIQAVINQDFNNKISIEECGEKVLNQMDNIDITHLEPNTIVGDRGSNTMERRVFNFSDFINEKKD